MNHFGAFTCELNFSVEQGLVLQKLHGSFLQDTLINENSIKVASYKYNVQINCFVFYLLRNRRGCRGIYDMLIPVNEVIIPNKWLNEIGDIQIGEWKTINKNLNYI